MSMTIEFYSAEAQELVVLFSEYLADDAILVEKLSTYPTAEFPGRLLLPDDLDNLCRILRQYRPLIPANFPDICVRELWNDGSGSESLTLLTDQFACEVATIEDYEIQQAALNWAATFSVTEPPEQSLPYKATIQLRTVAQDAARSTKSLIFCLAGAPGFFEYLRYL